MSRPAPRHFDIGPPRDGATAPACLSEVGIAVAEPIGVGIATGLKSWQLGHAARNSRKGKRDWLIALYRSLSHHHDDRATIRCQIGNQFRAAHRVQHRQAAEAIRAKARILHSFGAYSQLSIFSRDVNVRPSHNQYICGRDLPESTFKIGLLIPASPGCTLRSGGHAALLSLSYFLRPSPSRHDR